MSTLELTPEIAPASAKPSLWRRLFRAKDIGFYLMIVLAWIGAVYTTYDLDTSRWYWHWLIPIFGLICIVTEWNNVEPTPKARLMLIVHQVLHWGAALVLVRLAFNGFVLGYDWDAARLLLAYGVPAACFWWAARIFLRGRDGIVVRLLESGAALFATLLVLLQIRHAFHPGALGAERWDFAEAAWQCTALFACAVAALLLHRRGGRVAMLWAARAAGVIQPSLLAKCPWNGMRILPGSANSVGGMP